MSHLTCVRIPDDLYTKILMIAEVQGVSVSKVVNEALELYTS